MRLLLAVPLLVLLLAEPAAADPSLTGCRGSATSRTSDGTTLDEAMGVPVDDVTDPERRETFTRSNPFVVTGDGTVDWQGETDEVLTGGRWSIDVWGLTLADGDATNPERTATGQGALEVDSVVPAGTTGLVRAEATLTGQDGDPCTGSGWVRIEGDPAFSLPWLAGIGLVVAGIALAYAVQPRKVWT